MADCTIWAETLDVPNNVCEDARLHDHGAGILDDAVELAAQKWKYPDGPPYGQAGWDWGLQFDSLLKLVRQMENEKMPDFLQERFGAEFLPEDSLTRLAIHAHGEPGKIYVQGLNKTALTADNITTEWDFSWFLSKLGNYLKADATVIFMGCYAGLGANGTRLLKALSRESFPGRKVVLFATLGYAFPQQKRPGEPASRGYEPGMRDTDYTIPCGGDSTCQYKHYGQYFEKLDKLPWASESSPHARVALNGQIIRGEALEAYFAAEAETDRPQTAWE